MVIDSIKSYLFDLQDRICQMIEHEDGLARFQEDLWSYHEGGGGRTRVIANGSAIEKGGVNFSHVFGQALPKAATDKRPELANARFQALGVSVVMHPKNPYVPTSHLNVRYIQVDKPGQSPIWWFGGGFDLTPYYGFTEDCIHWHQMAKNACKPFGEELYPRYKKACDNYFYLHHREEPRGIGGIFFDDFNDRDISECFAFMQSVGNHYILGYQPIITKRKSHVFGQRERDFQLYRRGRYVEFNLLYDRGTLFGIQSKGRTESILMSLPPLTAWHYNYAAPSGSEEARLIEQYFAVRDWA